MNWIDPIHSVYKLFFGSPLEQITAVPQVIDLSLSCKDAYDCSGDQDILEMLHRRDCGGLAYMSHKEKENFQRDVAYAIHRLRKNHDPQLTYHHNYFMRCFVERRFEDCFEHLDASMQELVPMFFSQETKPSWTHYQTLCRVDTWVQNHPHLLQQWNKPNWMACFKDKACQDKYNTHVTEANKWYKFDTSLGDIPVSVSDIAPRRDRKFYPVIR